MTPPRSSVIFFVAVMLLSVPFWKMGTANTSQLLPGVPMSAFMFFVPGVVAFSIVAIHLGTGPALDWLWNGLHFSALRQPRWLITALAAPPVFLVGTYLLMRVSGQELPAMSISLGQAGFLLVVFFLPALFEEVGWSGYSLTAMQARTGAFQASLLVGCVWAVWHLVPLAQAGKSPEWIAWWCLTTIELRVLISWVFNNTGSVLVAATFHASENAAWQMFPSHGSHYDPKFHALILLFAAVAVVGTYGTSTLVRVSHARAD